MSINLTGIEEMIYTGCGKDFSGGFGIWSASKGFDKELVDDLYKGNGAFLGKGLSKILSEGKNKFTKESYGEITQTRKELKQGAVLHGLFNKKYREEDYVEVSEKIRGPIVVLKETGEGRLSSDIDYRENPEKAPFRIIATELADGRVVVVRRSYINKVYSDYDGRTGNMVDHIMVFPSGTKIEDIKKDLDKIPFIVGLPKKYFHSESFPDRDPLQAPKFLDSSQFILDFQEKSEKKLEAQTKKTVESDIKVSIPTKKRLCDIEKMNEYFLKNSPTFNFCFFGYSKDSLADILSKDRKYNLSKVMCALTIASLNFSNYKKYEINSSPSTRNNRSIATKYFNDFVKEGGDVEILRLKLAQEELKRVKQKIGIEPVLLDMENALENCGSPYDILFETIKKGQKISAEANRIFNSGNEEIGRKKFDEANKIFEEYERLANDCDPEMLLAIAKERQERLKIEAEIEWVKRTDSPAYHKENGKEVPNFKYQHTEDFRAAQFLERKAQKMIDKQNELGKEL